MIKLLTIIATALFAAAASAQIPSPAFVGYWHNWNDVNARYIDIDSVDDRYNVIAVAFAIPVSNTDMTMTFVPDRGTAQQLKTRIQRLQDQGKKVLLSIGGATAYVDLTTAANKDAFITSLLDILETYDFDGLDIDIEHGRSILIEGGTVAAPQNPAQINLIAAIKTIMAEYRATYGRKMLLTFAPETAYVQGGMSGFGNIWGGYLPMLDALRDSLDLIHVQLYNSGTMYGVDNKIYAQGTTDFIVAMTEAVIKGFATRGGGAFAGFAASKVAVGLPATANAAGGGYVDSASIDSAVTYLRGKGPRPGTYVLNKATGYPDLAGMMTWSINWDSTLTDGKSYRYAAVYEALFGEPPLQVPDQVQLIAPFHDQYLRQNSVQLRWGRTEPEVTSYHVEVRLDGRIVVSDTARTDTTLTMGTLTPASIYTWRVRARNATGWGPWNTPRTFRSVPFPTRPQLIEPTANRTLEVNTTTLQWGKASPDVLDYRVTLTLKSGSVVVDSIVTDTTLFVLLMPATTYMWRVQARNVSGAGEWSDTWSFNSLPYPDTVRLVTPADEYRHKQDTLTLVWRTGTPWITRYSVEVLYNAELMYVDSTLTDTTAMLTNLGCCGEYAWRVRAKNLAGWGPWSKQQTFTVVPVPDEVVITSPVHTSSVNVDSLVVAWRLAQPLVDRYHVRIMHDTVLQRDDSTLTTTTLPVRGLNADSTYDIRVRAGNVSGWGPWSSTVSVTLKTTEITSVDAASTSGSVVRIYPNPVQDVLIIEHPRDRAERITITDVRGVCVYDAWMPATEGLFTVDASPFAVGTYTVRVGNVVRLICRMR